jgi:acetyl esterase/lipase
MNLNKIVATVAGLLMLAGSSLTLAQVPPGPGGPGGPGAGPGLPPFVPSAPLRIERDLEYAKVGQRTLHLDLYLRDTADPKPLPVVVWVHGGGWIMGDKSPTPAARLVANGYAVASVEYRLAGEAPFPAQLYDVKAAVRWLRAHAQQYHLDGAHIGAWGNSAGGHLVALLGTTGDVQELEGDEGNLDQSSRVQAVADFFGPVDLMRMDATATQPKSNDPKLAEAILLGGPMFQNAAKAKAANPITYITPDDPPFLIVHGTADPLVPPRQSEFLQVALKHAGVENNLEYVPGAVHSMAQVQTPAIAEMVTNFFDKHLRGNQHQRDDLSGITEPPDSWIDPFSDDLPGTQYQLYDTPTRGAHTQASYRVYLPPGYDLPANAARRYPVIYYLHGLNDDSRKSVLSAYIPRLDVAIRTGLMPPAIVIAIQGLNRGWYVDSADGKNPMESVIIKDLIPHVDQTYRTVASREGRAIEGHSMGGAGALHLGFKYPDLFGTVASIAAALIPKEQFTSGMNLEMLKTTFGGDLARYDAEGAWSIVEKNADQIRGRTNIRLICGDQDALLARSKWMSEILTRLNLSHQLIESKGAPHSVKEVLARLDDDPFAFYGKAFAQFNGPARP